MAEERRVSTTPIPVPVPFGAPQPIAPSALSNETFVDPAPPAQSQSQEAEAQPTAPGAGKETVIGPTPESQAAAEDVAAEGDAAVAEHGSAEGGAAAVEPGAAEGDAAHKDVTMTDAPSAEKARVRITSAYPMPQITAADTPGTAQSPAPTTVPTPSAPSPAPARTGTPLRTNGLEPASRAASQLPDSSFTMPTEAPAHGAPVRQYLNSKVTGTLLEGMKQIAKEQPKDPLRALGEFLLQRSNEIET